MKRRKKPKKKISYQRFWRSVTKDGKAPCALKGVRKPCWGQKDAHHFFPKGRIDLVLDGKYGYRSIAAKTDVRNGVCLCRRHHEMVHQGMRPAVCPVPPYYGWFLAEHGLHDARPSARPDDASGSALGPSTRVDRAATAARASGVTDDLNSLRGDEPTQPAEPQQLRMED